VSETPGYQRFSNRQDNYARFRPTYPRELLDRLASTLALRAGGEVADIGAGTGIFTGLLLDLGLKVHAVEPNAEMLAVASSRLGKRPEFIAVAGTAEATTLPVRSVDAIFCAQAFHWFNTETTRDEWRRILRPGGHAVLVWNNLDQAHDLERSYQQVLNTFAVDGGEAMRRALAVQADNLLFPSRGGERLVFATQQELDYAGLVGRTESLSFAPSPDDPKYSAMLSALKRVFVRYQSAGVVTLRYQTLAIHGSISPS
jgi:ubiquinone/menaquinone biosynthesis C-methylase UbiE